MQALEGSAKKATGKLESWAEISDAAQCWEEQRLVFRPRVVGKVPDFWLRLQKRPHPGYKKHVIAASAMP